MNARVLRTPSAVMTLLLGALAPFTARADDYRGNTLTVEFQLAALPQTLRLCNVPGHHSADYSWILDTFAAAFEFEDSYFQVAVTSPPPTSHPCSPYTLPTAMALSARVLRVGSATTEIPAVLSIDFTRATLSVQIDGVFLTPADINVNYQAHTLGYTDALFAVRDYALPAGFPTSSPGDVGVVDPRDDVYSMDARSTLSPDWHLSYGLLDIVGMTARLEPTATVVVPGAIGPAMTGSWMDPAQSGHGLMLQVLEDQRLLATWFSFTPDGTQQAWFIGVGTYDGNTATITDVVRPEGGRWIPNFDPARVVMQPWGSLTITFSDCNHGRVQFDSIAGFGSGSMELTRLTLPAGLSCPSSTPAGDAR